MTRDRLFILQHDFADPEFAGRAFYCKDCMTVEGILAAFPDLAERIEVVRIPWPRPRAAVVDAIGAENQNLPSLVLAEGGFINEIEALLTALHTRHGIPERHP